MAIEIMSFPIQNGDFPVRYGHYQRVNQYPPVIKGSWEIPKLNESVHRKITSIVDFPRLEDPHPVVRCPGAKWILHPFQRIHELLAGLTKPSPSSQK